MISLIKEMKPKNKNLAFMTFGNASSITVPLEVKQDASHYATVTVISPNGDFISSMTGNGGIVRNLGSRKLKGTVSGTDLIITPEDSGAVMWGGGIVIVTTSNYTLSWGGKSYRPSERR